MLKELETISFLRQFLKIDFDIFNFFDNLSKNDDFNTLYILNYLHKFICSDEVAKRKGGAREFEDFIALMFNGVVADTKTRKNMLMQVPDFFVNAKDLVAKNRREKADIIFKNGSLSVKTLIPSNEELNLGSFDKKILFDGFGLEQFLTERKNTSGIGLGSKAQLKELLNIIKRSKNKDIFNARFKQMFKFIFNDDILIAIKENTKFTLYFLSSSELFDIFSSHIDDLSEIINRWEGNGLRVDRNKILKHCDKKVVLDFTILNNSIIDLINKFDLELHKAFGKYFNTTCNEKEIMAKLQGLFNEFKKAKSY